MTRYVEVPVPEDLVDSVRNYVNRLAFVAARPSWDAESIDAHLRALEPAARALACAVAERLIDGALPDDEDLAEHLGLSLREARGLVHEVNQPTGDHFRGNLVWVRFDESPMREPGPSRGEIAMLDAHAALVCEWCAANPSAPSAASR